jgi:hypothetical protein
MFIQKNFGIDSKYQNATQTRSILKYQPRAETTRVFAGQKYKLF